MACTVVGGCFYDNVCESGQANLIRTLCNIGIYICVLVTFRVCVCVCVRGGGGCAGGGLTHGSNRFFLKRAGLSYFPSDFLYLRK